MWSSWNHACLDSYRLRVVGSGVESIVEFFTGSLDRVGSGSVARG